MSKHVLGVYYAPGHARYEDHEYIRALQPPAVRVLDPDPTQLALVHRLAPDALLLPRDWALSEQHDDVRRDPEGTGQRHAREWREKLNTWRSTGVKLPGDERIVVVGINEPRVWDMLPQTVAYNVAFLDACERLGLRACALNLSVGWPDNNGPDTPPDWSAYAPVRDAIIRGNHFLCVHEYWYRTGPEDGGGWWAWRVNACPWNVPIIIGECGIDNYVDNERWQNEGKGPRGWVGNVDGSTYADHMARYVRGLDERVVAVLPFLTDYRAREWASFDTAGAHTWLVQSASQMVPEVDKSHTVHLPNVAASPVTSPPPTASPDAFPRALDFVLRWEGGWADNPNDPGGATMKGVTMSTFTRWRQAAGLPAPTKDDLRAIADDEVTAIYYQWYWLASGANKLPWPLALAHFDTAVNAGPGRAEQMLRDSDGDFVRYMGLLIDWYTRIANWEHFGRGWIRRRAALLVEASRV